MGQCQSTSPNLSSNVALKRPSTTAATTKDDGGQPTSEMFTCPGTSSQSSFRSDTLLLDTSNLNSRNTMDDSTRRSQNPSTRIVYTKTTITRTRYVGGRAMETTSRVVEEEGSMINQPASKEEEIKNTKEDDPLTTKTSQHLRSSNRRSRRNTELRASDSCPIIRVSNARNHRDVQASMISREGSAWFLSYRGSLHETKEEEEAEEEEGGLTSIYDDSFWTQDNDDEEEDDVWTQDNDDEDEDDWGSEEF